MPRPASAPHVPASAAPARWAMAAVALASMALGVLSACEPAGCLRGDEGCVIPTPCEGLSFECADPAVSVRVLAPGDAVPGGIDALAADGDVLLSNGVVHAVIDALDHPHYVAPTGGHLLDLTSADNDNDSLTHMFGAVGLLPGDSIAYLGMVLEIGTGYVAVQVDGRLAGLPDSRVATRYELRECEPGLRVRTEIVNLSTEPRPFTLVDAWYWSGREALPFGPAPGRGFMQPGLVTPVEDSWEPFPFMVASAHADPAATYFEVACSERALYGFHSDQISAQGLAPRVVQPRDHVVFERFIGVAAGRDVSGGADLALEIREQLFEEPQITLAGRVVSDALGDEARATVLIEEGDEDTPREERTPWTQVTPDEDGRFVAQVPARRPYVLTVQAFGRDAAVRTTPIATNGIDVGEIPIAEAGTLDASVTVDGLIDWAQIFVHPADDATADAVRAKLHGGFFECAPLLGSGTGGSPACNRALVNGDVALAVPAGRYDVYATAGMFATVARERVTIGAGETVSVSLALTRLDVTPPDTLGGDFHVHGGASFDSTMPDFDRVAAWLASGIEVIAATDHDVIWDYEDARRMLDADARVQVLVGLETTGQILFDLTPGETIPQVIGHWNVWPLGFAPEQPYNGAPWDELVEPGALFDRFAAVGWPTESGVIQLNHPWAAAQFGRDLGFPFAVGVDARVPLPREDDGTGPALVLRTPEDAGFSNADYHTQEVMNGSANEDLQPYRAYWFYLLNQGIVRAATANSDSHTLVDNVVGTPRTLVFTDQRVGPSFDQAAFNAAVRAGRMVGTNGPVIELTTTDASGAVRSPSVDAFAPAADARLVIRVSAAPWVPVEEIRVVVNGEVARTLSAELTRPSDPFGVDEVLRFEGEVSLAEVLPPGDADAWIVVEAGAPLPTQGDVNCDGIVDTGDNNGDGTIDWRDVERDEDDNDELPPQVCDRDQRVGPLAHPPTPGPDDPGYPFWAVTPDGYPMSFTNPLLLDRDGGGFSGPGLP